METKLKSNPEVLLNTPALLVAFMIGAVLLLTLIPDSLLQPSIALFVFIPGTIVLSIVMLWRMGKSYVFSLAVKAGLLTALFFRSVMMPSIGVRFGVAAILTVVIIVVYKGWRNRQAQSQMSEANLIARTKTPLTITSLTEQLQRCGLAEGQTVLVHIAMSKLGWVIGGAQTVIEALIAAVGETGTIMMVTHSSVNTDPQHWSNPPIPEAWWQMYRDNAPAYNPAKAPTRGMGAVPELFRTWPGVVRSDHPAFSMAAFGRNAHHLTANHTLNDCFSHNSPLGKLYELDGHVLLLGVNHGNNTSLHYAECRADFPGKTMEKTSSAVVVDGKRAWVTYTMQETHEDDFARIGAAFDAEHGVTINKIADADVRFFKQRAAVDFGVQWMEANRNFTKPQKQAV